MTADKYAQLQELGKTTAETIRGMVAALNVDYARLEELRNLVRDDPDGETGEGIEKAKAELAELENAAGDCSELEDAERHIDEHPLEVTVRSGWQSLGEQLEPAEFCILLSTGGPATRICGELDEHREPRRAWIETQDWFQPWTQYLGDAISQDDLLTYCGHFIFAM